MNSKYSSGFAPLMPDFDAFILDLWGVIHDGQALYPGAKECLERLRGAWKKVVLLSNAPRRASSVGEALQRMDITPDFYDALITSGEICYQSIADMALPIFRPTGGAYVYIGLEKDRDVLHGLPYYETDDVEDAHFLLLSHSWYDNQPQSEWEPLLTRCLAANLPALCINPDLEIVRQNGEQVYCAGILAENYAAKGGEVVYFGKPHKVVYDACFKALANTPLRRILTVGDSLVTDIRGGNDAGLKSALIIGGVLKNKVGEPESQNYRPKLEGLFASAKAFPDYVLPAFNW